MGETDKEHRRVNGMEDMEEAKVLDKNWLTLLCQADSEYDIDVPVLKSPGGSPARLEILEPSTASDDVSSSEFPVERRLISPFEYFPLTPQIISQNFHDRPDVEQSRTLKNFREEMKEEDTGETDREQPMVNDKEGKEEGEPKVLQKNWLKLLCQADSEYNDVLGLQSPEGSPARLEISEPSTASDDVDSSSEFLVEHRLISPFEYVPLTPQIISQNFHDRPDVEQSRTLRFRSSPPVDNNIGTGCVLFNCGQMNHRNNPRQKPREGKDETIIPPYPWSTNIRAKVHTIEYLSSQNIHKISGEVSCRNCAEKTTLEYDLYEKFVEISAFIFANVNKMFLRAPAEWCNPKFPKCTKCGTENSLVPVLSPKKRSINWLFLLLTDTIGHCGIRQLKYFCKHNKAHRTGAKDRVLYSTYMSLCSQLDPNEPRFS